MSDEQPESNKNYTVCMREKGKGVQCAINVVVTGHDKPATNFIKLMPAHMRSIISRICVCAHAKAELAVSLNQSI